MIPEDLREQLRKLAEAMEPLRRQLEESEMKDALERLREYGEKHGERVRELSQPLLDQLTDPEFRKRIQRFTEEYGNHDERPDDNDE